MAQKNTKSSHTYNITLVISPPELDVGQMLQVSTAFTDPYGKPIVVPEIYMQILDSTGREVWPLSVMERNSFGFAKLISTAELQPNTRYTIRVSKNSDLSNHRFGYFKTSKKKLPLLLLPLTVAPILVTPLIPKKAEIPFVYVYRTELDGKVCSKCKDNEGKRFEPRDPNIIRIGPPELGGETHWRCRCHYDMIMKMNPAYAKVKHIHNAISAIKAVVAVEEVQKLKNKELVR